MYKSHLIRSFYNPILILVTHLVSPRNCVILVSATSLESAWMRSDAIIRII